MNDVRKKEFARLSSAAGDAVKRTDIAKMGRCTAALCCLSLALAVQLCLADTFLPGAFQTRQSAADPHHSLSTMMDKNLLFWKMGGSTVVTKNYVRLTPAAQSKRGWLWNDFHLKPNWDIEVKFRVEGRTHFGADGWGIWILAESMFSLYKDDPLFLSGPIFGMRADFKGFGVLFDTYDNDGQRDNPTIFAIENSGEKPFMFNHDDDFKPNMLKSPVASLPGVPYKCTADYRNPSASQASKVLLRMMNGNFFVYIDVADGAGYKLCLATPIKLDEQEQYHLAFSAMTGELADQHDLLEITTRFLTNDDAEIDNSKIQIAQSSSSFSLTWFFWGIICLTQIGLTLSVAFELVWYNQLLRDKMNTVLLCQKLNQLVLPHYVIYLSLCTLLLITFRMFPLFINLPLVAYRVYALLKNAYMLEPAQLAINSAKVHGFGVFKINMKHTTKKYILLAFYVCVSLLYIHQMATA